MSSTLQVLSDLRVRLNTFQPIVWIETDEPNRAAQVLREYIVSYAHDFYTKLKSDRPVFEYDISSGLHKIASEGALVKKNVPDAVGTTFIYGQPVEWCNSDVTSNQVANQAVLKSLKNNVDPNRPWRFITDMMENAESHSIILAHNFAEIIDLAMKNPAPPAQALMRNVLLQLTGTMSICSSAQPFNGSSRMLIATGRLPDPSIARSEILDTFDIIKLDRPTDDELKALLTKTLSAMAPDVQKEIVAKNGALYRVDSAEEQIDRAALNLKGLTYFSAETAAVRTVNAVRCFDPGTLTKQRKTLIERTPGLRLVEPSADKAWDRVKGLENFELFARRTICEATDPRLRVNSMTFIGPPGTGKSMGAAGLANFLGWPLIECQLAQVFSKYIGESQSGMKQLVQTLDGLGNCVVLFDEVDKQFDGLISDGGQRGDGGVGSQVMQMLLTWEQERTSKANGPIIVRTANRINNLRAETQRAGRNDATFYVDFPHISARREIIKMYLKDYGVDPETNVVESLARKTRMWSGAELKELAKNVARFGSDNDDAFKFIRPIYKLKQEETNKLRQEAKEVGIPASANNVDEEDNSLIEEASKRAVSSRTTHAGRAIAQV